MAQFTKSNGDLLPVLNLDYPAYTNSGANAVSTANTVQPQGPKLDFFTITVYIYEFTTAGPDTLAMAVYPTGAWTTATLQTATRAALTAGGAANAVVASATATFTG